MSVFLRWGIFGILGVAALLYAYNASKRMAEQHVQKPPVIATEETTPVVSARPEAAVPVAPATPAWKHPPAPAHCETELTIAKRAIEARKAGEPLDRLLRIQEIAFEDWQPRRERFERVAKRYYDYGGDFIPEALRIAVISDCVQHSPNPGAIPAS